MESKHSLGTERDGETFLLCCSSPERVVSFIHYDHILSLALLFIYAEQMHIVNELISVLLYFKQF